MPNPYGPSSLGRSGLNQFFYPLLPFLCPFRIRILANDSLIQFFRLDKIGLLPLKLRRADKLSGLSPLTKGTKFLKSFPQPLRPLVKDLG
jgi:hypothetical protein